MKPERMNRERSEFGHSALHPSAFIPFAFDMVSANSTTPALSVIR